jgi:hypothetical protein
MIAQRVNPVVLAAASLCLAWAMPSAHAQEAGVESDCSLLCSLLGRKATPAPQPVAEAQAVESPGDTALPSKPKAKAKPKVSAVVIAAGEPEAASTSALAAGLRGHPVKIIKTTTPGALRSADLSVEPLVKPAEGKTASLFREDLHVIGLTEIATLADLEGRTVSLGAEGSPAQAIARRVLAARHIKVKEVPLDLDNALDGLASGDIDAVAVLAPQPFARLQDLPGDKLHLVTAASSAGDGAELTPSVIPANAYPKLSGNAATSTLSVDAVVAANPKSPHPREAAVVLAALNARAQKTLASARPDSEMRSVAVSH